MTSGTGNLRVYIGNADSGDINVLRMDAETAALEEIQRVPIPGFGAVTNSLPLTVHPNRRVLYANPRSPAIIQSFRIDPQSGALSHMEGSRVEVPECVYISPDHGGRFLLGACYQSEQLFVCPIGPDGAAGPVQQTVKLLGSIHAVDLDPSNRFIFYTECGAARLARRSFDPETGRIGDDLEDVALDYLRPRHIAFHPNNRFIYVLYEFDGVIEVFDYEVGSGAFRHRSRVSARPTGEAGRLMTTDIHATPDGSLVYSADRQTNTIAALRCGDGGATLSVLEHFPTEDFPRSFAITTDGRFLLAAGQKSDRIAAYSIDAASGALEQVASCATGANPSWVEIVELG